MKPIIPLGSLFVLVTMALSAHALDQQQVVIKPIGKAFSPNATVPSEIPATLQIPAGDKLPAVVIVHGSGGVDGRGALSAKALNDAGIATLELDMWKPRGVVNFATRPRNTLDTLPDVYGALAYLNAHPRIKPGQVGVMGFSWGGVVSMATAFGALPQGVSPSADLRFKAHAPFYPVCDVWAPGGRASRIMSLDQPTGAPVLLHNGTSDDYDADPNICAQLPGAHPKMPLEVVMVTGATHGFDGETAYPVFFDPAARGGKGANIRMTPNREEGRRARERVVAFFKKHLE